MSDLRVTPEALAPAQSPLPVGSYFDPALYEREVERLFARSPRYIGHSLAVPEVGDYFALPQENEGRALLRTPAGLRLVSNVCRHRQAVMLRGRGNTGSNIVCPLHRWTYDLGGQLIGAPHFADDPCRDLANFPVQTWNGMVFDVPRIAGAPGVTSPPNSPASAPRASWTSPATCSTASSCTSATTTGRPSSRSTSRTTTSRRSIRGSASSSPARTCAGSSARTTRCRPSGPKNELAKPGSPAYRKWHDAVLAYREGRFDDPVPRHGAIWLTYYPATMVEWYPHVLVVSTLVPKGPQKTLNVVEFYYPEDIHAFEREFVEAEQAAYWETCAEDDEIALRMDAGRRALLERGDDDFGPYQSPMEDGMQQFHEWYQKAMR
jgi:phenylpropionate dioxygenase-like ring-hydroxylating dioxygenase large terminal subunit